ncbi:MAG: hypothetical protein JWR10_4708 [Rubritepida sp.]|nr:hypothetical protein [Rubritepida sp.]
MEQHITIARDAAEVLAYVADPANIRNWLPQLRREESGLPHSGLHLEKAEGSVRWSFEPAGEWHVTASGDVTTLRLVLSAETAKPNDPTEEETPHEALLHGAEAALQSLKSHLERAGGGDPVLRTRDTDIRAFGHSATQDPDI